MLTSNNLIIGEDNVEQFQLLPQQQNGDFCSTSSPTTIPPTSSPSYANLQTSQCLSPSSPSDTDATETDGSSQFSRQQQQQQQRDSTQHHQDYSETFHDNSNHPTSGSLRPPVLHCRQQQPFHQISQQSGQSSPIPLSSLASSCPPSSSASPSDSSNNFSYRETPNCFSPSDGALGGEAVDDTPTLHPYVSIPPSSSNDSYSNNNNSSDSSSTEDKAESPPQHHPQFVTNSPTLPSPSSHTTIVHPSLASFSSLHSGASIHLPMSPELVSPALSPMSPNAAAALLNWQGQQQHNSNHQASSSRGTRFTAKSNSKKKRVTISGVDGGKYSLSGKRIGRPRVDRENTRCHECDTITTPQWRFLTHEELMNCPIPLRLPALLDASPTLGTQLLGDPNSPNNNKNNSNENGNNSSSNSSSSDGQQPSSSSSLGPSEGWTGKDGLHQALCSTTPGGTATTGLHRKVCLCNACWLRVHKAKQKLKNGGRVISSPCRRRSAASNVWYASPSSPPGPSTRLTTVLEELASKNGEIDNEQSLPGPAFPHHSLQSDPRSPSSPSLDSNTSSSSTSTRIPNVRVDASNAAASVIEAAATLAMRGNSGDNASSEMIWLAPGLRYGGSLQGQPIILMNGQDFLVLPPVHATASPEQRSHLQEVQQRIEEHILQHVSDQIRQVRHNDDAQHQAQEANRQLQVPQDELRLLHAQLQQQQQQLQQRQQFMELLESSSHPAPTASPHISPFDSIFKASSHRGPSSSGDIASSNVQLLHDHTQHRQQSNQLERERRESLASLTAAAQELLSASTAGASQTTPLLPPASPNTAHVMAQLNALTLSPLAGVSLNVLNTLPGGNTSMLPPNGIPPQVTLQDWQPPSSIVVDYQGRNNNNETQEFTQEMSQQQPTLAPKMPTTLNITPMGSLNGQSSLPTEDLGMKISSSQEFNNGSSSSTMMIHQEMQQDQQQQHGPSQSQSMLHDESDFSSSDTKMEQQHESTSSYLDHNNLNQPNHNHNRSPQPNFNGMMFPTDSCANNGRTDVQRDVNLLRPMLTNHWLFY